MSSEELALTWAPRPRGATAPGSPPTGLSVLRFPRHLLDGPSDPCPHFCPTSIRYGPLLQGPWVRPHPPRSQAHRLGRSLRRTLAAAPFTVCKEYWPTSHFEYVVNLASLKRRQFQVQLGKGSWTDTPHAGLPLQDPNFPRNWQITAMCKTQTLFQLLLPFPFPNNSELASEKHFANVTKIYYVCAVKSDLVEDRNWRRRL